MADGPESRKASLKAAAGSLLRSGVTALVLVALYYRAPLDRPLDGFTGLLFLAALLAFCAVIAFQLRGILRARHPRLQAIRALSVALPMLLVVFASTYWVVAAQDPDAFTQPLNRTDGLYFTVTVFTTVGFGDISPVSQLARVLVTIQMIIGLVTVGLIAKLVVGAVSVAVARQAAVEPEPADGE